MAKANWFETAFGAAVGEARSAITDVRSKLIEESADVLSFMFYNMNMQVIYGDVKQ